jgi:hypothetical protein
MMVLLLLLLLLLLGENCCTKCCALCHGAQRIDSVQYGAMAICNTRGLLARVEVMFPLKETPLLFAS